MNYRHATEIILVVNLLALIAWDFVAEFKAGDEATISRVLYDGAKAYPILAVAVGILLGHLYASQNLAGVLPPLSPHQ